MLSIAFELLVYFQHPLKLSSRQTWVILVRHSTFFLVFGFAMRIPLSHLLSTGTLYSIHAGGLIKCD